MNYYLIIDDNDDPVTLWHNDHVLLFDNYESAEDRCGDDERIVEVPRVLFDRDVLTLVREISRPDSLEDRGELSNQLFNEIYEKANTDPLSSDCDNPFTVASGT